MAQVPWEVGFQGCRVIRDKDMVQGPGHCLRRPPQGDDVS